MAHETHETHETHENKGPKRFWKARNDFTFLGLLKICPPFFCFVCFVCFVGANCFFLRRMGRGVYAASPANDPRHSCAPNRAYAEVA